MGNECSEKRGVKCPNRYCKERWAWDWCADTWFNVKTGEFCGDEFFVPESKCGDIKLDDPEGIIAYKCTCGQILAFIPNVQREGGEGIYNHHEWSDVDWEENGV